MLRRNFPLPALALALMIVIAAASAPGPSLAETDMPDTSMPQDSMSEDSGIIVPPMRRNALIVADLDRSQAFYEQVLGLEVWSAGELKDNPEAMALLGLEGGDIRYAILKAPSLAFGMVGLFEVSNPAPPVAEPRAPGVRIGESIMVWEIENLDPVIEKLDELGTVWVSEPVMLSSERFQRSQREMTFRDPDGFAINVIEKLDGPAMPPVAEETEAGSGVP